MNEAKQWAKAWNEYISEQHFLLDAGDIAADAFEAGFDAARKLDRTKELKEILREVLETSEYEIADARVAEAFEKGWQYLAEKEDTDG